MKLKDCALCGSQAEVQFYTLWHNHELIGEPCNDDCEIHDIACTNGECLLADGVSRWVSLENAIKLWNDRRPKSERDKDDRENSRDD